MRQLMRTRKIPIIIILILLAIGLYMFVYQRSELAKLHEERELLEMEIARLELVKEALQEELSSTDSRDYIESVAMSRYSMVRPYEIIYYVTGDPE